MLIYGFITINRNKLARFDWSTDVNTKCLFMHLLVNANYETQSFMGMEINRGEIATSYPTLCAETGLSERNVRTALKHLKDTGYLTLNRHPKFSIISIKNYDEWTASDTQLTPDRQVKRHPTVRSTDTRPSPNVNNISNANQYNQSNQNKESYSSGGEDAAAIARIVSAWNNAIEDIACGVAVKTVSQESQRYKSLLTRISENGVDGVLEAIGKVEDSEFFKNGVSDSFKLSIDWFLNPDNFQKLREGCYDKCTKPVTATEPEYNKAASGIKEYKVSKGLWNTADSETQDAFTEILDLYKQNYFEDYLNNIDAGFKAFVELVDSELWKWSQNGFHREFNFSASAMRGFMEDYLYTMRMYGSFPEDMYKLFTADGMQYAFEHVLNRHVDEKLPPQPNSEWWDSL